MVSAVLARAVPPGDPVAHPEHRERGDAVVGLPEHGAVDIHTASGGRFGPEPLSVYEQWAKFVDWAAALPAPSHSTRGT
jgi:hypothetical protein